MSKQREPLEPLPPEDQQFAALLQSCLPAAPAVNRDRLLWEAGRAAALAEAKRTARFWRAACGLSAAAAVLAALSVLAPPLSGPRPAVDSRPAADAADSAPSDLPPPAPSWPAPSAEPDAALAAAEHVRISPGSYLTQRRLAVAFGVDSLPLPTSARGQTSSTASATRVGSGITRGHLGAWGAWPSIGVGDNR